MSLQEKIKQEGNKIYARMIVENPATGKIETYDYDTRYVLASGDSLLIYRPSTDCITRLPGNAKISFES